MTRRYSFQTLHHFDHDQKRALYTRIRRALKEDGVYLEGDYMVERREEEEAGFARSACLRREQGIPEGTLLHLDTPCAVDTQIRLLREAGFARVESVLRRGNTTLLMALRFGSRPRACRAGKPPVSGKNQDRRIASP